MAQDGMLGGNLVVRTAGDPMKVLPAVKAAIWSVNKDQRLTDDTVTLEGYMDRLIAQRRFNMAVLALFGGLGLVIAGVGIYGVMAYVVAQRTNEIGVRMALGATRGNVVAMVLKRASVLMVAGLAIGGAGAWLLSGRVKDFLFEMQPTDLGAFAGAIVRARAGRARGERHPRAARGVGRSDGRAAAGVMRLAPGAFFGSADGRAVAGAFTFAARRGDVPPAAVPRHGAEPRTLGIASGHGQGNLRLPFGI